jgi:hypothetical protein
MYVCTYIATFQKLCILGIECFSAGTDVTVPRYVIIWPKELKVPRRVVLAIVTCKAVYPESSGYHCVEDLLAFCQVKARTQLYFPPRFSKDSTVAQCSLKYIT